MKPRTGDTLTGPAGTAIEILVELDDTDPPDWGATIANYFLTCPGQSIAWPNYLLSCIHLRPIDGVQPAVVKIPHATHEVMLLALNPAAKPTPTDPRSWQHLTPANLMEQVELPDDDAARHLLHDAAQAVVDGILWAEPPLSGQVEPWRTSLIRTSAHLRGEPHAP